VGGVTSAQCMKTSPVLKSGKDSGDVGDAEEVKACGKMEVREDLLVLVWCLRVGRRVLALGASSLKGERVDIEVASPVLAHTVIAECGSRDPCAVAEEVAEELCEDCAGERDSLISSSSLSKSESESVVESTEDAVEDAGRRLTGRRPGLLPLDIPDPELEEFAENVLKTRRFRDGSREEQSLCLGMPLDWSYLGVDGETRL
jgi:hypothetical protein